MSFEFFQTTKDKKAIWTQAYVRITRIDVIGNSAFQSCYQLVDSMTVKLHFRKRGKEKNIVDVLS